MTFLYNKETEKCDRDLTIKNRGRLLKNRNLLFWYEKLFQFQFLGIDNIRKKNILEIGSGTSPLKLFYSNVITSDIMDLDYLDMVLDCHAIDNCDEIGRESFDIIVVTNVLHHLKDPLLFILKAVDKLKQNGYFILTEPYFSTVSRLIYEKIHHEFSSFDIPEPQLSKIDGPLSSANQALPYMIFFGNRGWDAPLKSAYKYDVSAARYFSSLSYMMTGGISRKLPIPFGLYKFFFQLDMRYSQAFPRLFSSFFVLRLEKNL